MASGWNRISASTRLAFAALTAILLVTTADGQQAIGDLDERAIRVAVEQALATAPRGYQALQSPSQAGVRVLDVRVERTSPSAHRITIDLSQRALTYDPSGDVEAITTHVIESTATLTAGSRDVEYRILVDGLPLDQLLPRLVGGRGVTSRQVGAPGRVVVSAGHGWYRHEASGQWRLQRDYYWGIVEDFVNYDIVTYLLAELRAASLDARPARNPDRGAGAGVSGHPRWQESAKYFIRDLGAPPSVWDFGADDYAKDINSRPYYANWIDAAVIVSIHNNGGGGSGTETWTDTTNPYDAESRRLAEIINRRVVSAIRARYNAAWPDRGLRSCNGCHGENRLAARPAVIVEIAFMDTRSPDNEALQDERFKQIVAQAIREGLQEWGLRGAAPAEDFDSVARREISARAAQDPRFAGVIDGSYGSDPNWDAAWELRWLDVNFTGGRLVRVWHAAYRADRSIRYTAYWDPDTGAWRGWTPVF